MLKKYFNQAFVKRLYNNGYVVVHIDNVSPDAREGVRAYTEEYINDNQSR